MTKKSLGEIQKRDLSISIVRFGNVLGSSVLYTFLSGR